MILSYVLYALYHNSHQIIQTWLKLDEYTTSTKLRMFAIELWTYHYQPALAKQYGDWRINSCIFVQTDIDNKNFCLAPDLIIVRPKMVANYPNQFGPIELFGWIGAKLCCSANQSKTLTVFFRLPSYNRLIVIGHSSNSNFLIHNGLIMDILATKVLTWCLIFMKFFLFLVR